MPTQGGIVGTKAAAPTGTTQQQNTLPSQFAAKQATLYGPGGQKQVVGVGSQQASDLQKQGYGLTPGSYKAPVTASTVPQPTQGGMTQAQANAAPGIGAPQNVPQASPNQTPQPQQPSVPQIPQQQPQPAQSPQPVNPNQDLIQQLSQNGLLGQALAASLQRASQPTPEYTSAQENLQKLSSQPSPQVQQAIENLKNFQTGYAQSVGGIQSTPIPLEFQQGREQVLQGQYSRELPAYQEAVQSSLGQQQQQIGALQSILGQANTQQQLQQQGIAGVAGALQPTLGQYGQAQYAPLGGTVQPTTTPGYQILNPSDMSKYQPNQIQKNPDGTITLKPGVTPIQGTVKQVSLPAALGGQQGGDVVPQSDPFYQQMQAYANLLVNNQGSAIPSSVTGNAALNAQLIRMAQQINPNFNVNIAAGVGGAQQAIVSGQTQQIATYQSALQQGQNLKAQFSDLVRSFSLNPSDVNKLNQGIQSIANNVSDPHYQQLNNYINEIANTYANALTPAGGNPTDYKTSIAQGMLNSTMKGQNLLDVMNSLDDAVKAKIAGIPTAGSFSGQSQQQGQKGIYDW